MGADEALQRIAVKIFAEPAEEFELLRLIPVFHRWIQTDALDGLLIDVADYSHVSRGPGIMLIGDAGDYSLDLAGGRMGLQYARKRAQSGDLAARMEGVCKAALGACRLLEAAPELGNHLRFDAGEIQVTANDRLAAPNTAEARQQITPHLKRFLGRLYAGAPYRLTFEEDPRERLSVHVRTDEPADTQALHARLIG